MSQVVEVVRIEEQLTVPTRADARLVDVWVSLKWPVLNTKWIETFAELSRSYRGALSYAGQFEVVPLGTHQGWVVARGVDLSHISQAEVDALVRGLVARANAQATQREPAAQEPAVRRRRLREVIPERMSATLQEWFAPRTSVDVASNG